MSTSKPDITKLSGVKPYSTKPSTTKPDTLKLDTLKLDTLGKLKESNWQSVSVKSEIRRNLVRALATQNSTITPASSSTSSPGSTSSPRQSIFPAIHGYEESVFPAIQHALLAGHDIIFLGERGQAKTRIIRSLTSLLDEWTPKVAGSELNDNPLAPISAGAREQVAKLGDDTPIEWMHRNDRFAEKLATPDTSIADLIGEVDPIKVAEGRYLSDELTMHYGLVPRTNRGIFAINELPDLAERIQVGLLNVLEERDVQIRGYRIRLPLDLLLVASANPEDYTNRGRIITPLKDRFGTQVRTHYPTSTAIELDIMTQEVDDFEAEGLEVKVPDFMAEIVATLSQLARRSPHINQRSGVSLRLSVANYETLVASAVRRALLFGKSTESVSTHDTTPQSVSPRICDLSRLYPSTAGKIEVETLEEDRDEEVMELLLKSAVLAVFRDSCRPSDCAKVAEAFTEDITFSTGDNVPSESYLALVEDMPQMARLLRNLGYKAKDLKNPELVASGVEFVLEGLHLSKRLNKTEIAAERTGLANSGATYQGKTRPPESPRQAMPPQD